MEALPLPRTAALLVNAHARSGQDLFEEACAKLRAVGIEVALARAVRDPTELAETMRAAIASGAPMVIVGGGDGTLSSLVDPLAGTDIVFGVLPLGTANSFARSLNLPLDLDGAIGVLATGKARRIDLGMIDDDYFCNCASIGLAPKIAETVPHHLKRWLGRPGYLAWAAWKFARFHPFRVTIGEGAAAETIEAVEVRIANGAYHGGVELVDEASLTSGEIVVQAVIGNARHSLLWSWAASLLKLRLKHRTTREFRGKSLRISTDPPLPISIDGEVLAKTPITARIAPRAVMVASPA